MAKFIHSVSFIFVAIKKEIRIRATFHYLIFFLQTLKKRKCQFSVRESSEAYGFYTRMKSIWQGLIFFCIKSESTSCVGYYSMFSFQCGLQKVVISHYYLILCVFASVFFNT